MKVNIGPYRSWIGPYQIAEFILTPLTWFKPPRKSKLLQALEDGESDAHGKLCHKFGEFLAYGSIREESDHWSFKDDREPTWLSKFCSWIDSKKERKIKVRIDSWDTWGMSHTLALIILPMLKQSKEKKHGAPYTDDSDVPEELRSTAAPAQDDDHIDGNHFKRWDWIMDEMIWAFEQQLDDSWEDQYYTGKADYYFQKIPELNASEMKTGTNHTLVVDYDGLKKHQERMQNGFRLFGKYYQNLGD